MVTRNCEVCGKTISKPPSRMKNGKGRFCSMRCRSIGIGAKIERVCESCGVKFLAFPCFIKAGQARYCSQQCSNSARKKESKRICRTCGKAFNLKPSRIRKCGLFCSISCASKNRLGKEAAAWKGGISFRPYCDKFNDAIKEVVRNRFGRKCFICDKPECGRKHDVHHVDYNKSQGCKGLEWGLIPLCNKCHSRTSGNRWYWFALLRDYWIYKYGVVDIYVCLE